MGIFVVYFIICFLALLVRGYYRVPQSCIIQEIIDKEEDTKKSIIADRFECNCHYTNFLWDKGAIDRDNETRWNATATTGEHKLRFEPIALVRGRRRGHVKPARYSLFRR